MNASRAIEENGSPLSHLRELSGELFLPIALAAAVTGCFTWSALQDAAPEASLLRICGAAMFLACIVFYDVRELRIPNRITFPALAAVLVGATALDGFGAGLEALGGAAVALAIGLIPFVFRILGAGDVKAMMVIGALHGAGSLVAMAWWMVIAGGLLAVGLVVAQPGGLRDLAARWGRSAWYSVRSARIVYFEPQQGTAAASGLPFAVAIGLGASAFNVWGPVWV